MVCAGGVGNEAGFVAALKLGYAGVQMGTRFIATTECRASEAYKRAIVVATAEDVVHTERLSGVPVAVLKTPYISRIGTAIGPVARWLFQGRRTKKWIRTYFALRAIRSLKQTSIQGEGRADDPATAIWQAGMSVAGIDAVEPAAAIVTRFANAARSA